MSGSCNGRKGRKSKVKSRRVQKSSGAGARSRTKALPRRGAGGAGGAGGCPLRVASCPLPPSTRLLRPSTLDPRPSSRLFRSFRASQSEAATVSPRRSTLDARRSTLVPRPSSLDARLAVISAGAKIFLCLSTSVKCARRRLRRKITSCLNSRAVSSGGVDAPLTGHDRLLVGFFTAKAANVSVAIIIR